MFYKDRHEKFSEIGKMRAMIVERDEALRESQNLFDKMKEQKEDWERKSGEFEVKLGQTEADLTAEKAERKSEKEASDQQILVLNNNIAGLEQQKLDTEEKHIKEIDDLKAEHGEKIKALGKEITLADAAGYKRGIDEMMAKQKGGENVDEDSELAINPFSSSQLVRLCWRTLLLKILLPSIQLTNLESLPQLQESIVAQACSCFQLDQIVEWHRVKSLLYGKVLGGSSNKSSKYRQGICFGIHSSSIWRPE